MDSRKTQWKRGRGKLGFLAPLIGTWHAMSDSPMGPVSCTRSLAFVLGNNFVRLEARWQFGDGEYQEHCLIGCDAHGSIRFWSFTSDGKRSEGDVCDVTDIHPEAIGFQATMPAGIARMAYWPDGSDGFFWAVESKTKKGWRRFTEHRYRRLAE